MEKELLVYENPQIELIAVEVEKGFAASPENVENPTEDKESEW